MEIKNTFDNEAGVYEQTSRKVNIHYDEALSTMIELMPNNANNILDVCCGTGILTELVNRKYPQARISGVDFSSGMLEVATQRLNNKNINFYNYDLLDCKGMNLIKEKFDLVVSSFGIHNIHTRGQKIVALTNIATLMNHGATYITCDILKGDSEQEELNYYKIQKNHLLKSFNEKETNDWLTLLNEEDDKETWGSNKDILEKAGLKNVKMLWKKDFLAIWSAEKL